MPIAELKEEMSLQKIQQKRSLCINMNEKVEIKNNLNISNYNDEDLIKLFKTLSLEHKRDCFKAYFLYIMMGVYTENDKDKSDGNS